jgi:levansucrase
MLIERLRRGLAPVALLGLVLTGTAAGAQPQEAEPTPRAVEGFPEPT